MRLSKNFSLKELIRSETATRKGINNNAREHILSNKVIKHLEKIQNG